MEFDVDQVVQFLGPAYGEVSPDGEDHFPVVAAKIGEMAAERAARRPGRARHGSTHRSLVMFADDDLMTLGARGRRCTTRCRTPSSPSSPGTSHFLTQEKPHLVNALCSTS